jgi:aminomethyltransferase
MGDGTKKTRLHGWHVENGANMAGFGDYEMPLWYPAGVKNEHLGVLKAAGIFDTSHMSVVPVGGPDAFDLLQECFSKDLSACIGKDRRPLSPGQSVYGVFLNPDGHVIDDAIVFEIVAGNYLVVVNAGMGAPIAAHLRRHAGSRDVDIVDRSDDLGKFDVQGPASLRILKQVLKNPEQVFDRLPYFSFKGHFDPAAPHAETVQLLDGTPILLSRTGYTGEFGFEIFVEPGAFLQTWKTVMEAGRPLGMLPCGLASRDSLRAGAVLPLSHQDIGPWPFVNHPWPFALPYTEDGSGFTKPFIGAEALLSGLYSEHTLPFAGYDLRKVDTHETGSVLDQNKETLGRVLTCTTDMAIGRMGERIVSINSPDLPEDFKPRGLCCGFVKVDRPLNPGQTVILKDRRREIKVEIVTDIRPHRSARSPLSRFL